MAADFTMLLRDGAPRVCGDDPHEAFMDAEKRLCSPRMRG